MNNKICNEKTEVPETSEMNEKDYLTTILSMEKAMVKNYATALTEASNNDLYNHFYDMFDAISSSQRQIYELMFKKGWYCIEMAQDNKITEKLSTFSKELPQIEK